MDELFEQDDKGNWLVKGTEINVQKILGLYVSLGRGNRLVPVSTFCATIKQKWYPELSVETISAAVKFAQTHRPKQSHE